MKWTSSYMTWGPSLKEAWVFGMCDVSQTPAMGVMRIVPDRSAPTLILLFFLQPAFFKATQNTRECTLCVPVQKSSDRLSPEYVGGDKPWISPPLHQSLKLGSVWGSHGTLVCCLYTWSALGGCYAKTQDSRYVHGTSRDIGGVARTRVVSDALGPHDPV